MSKVAVKEKIDNLMYSLYNNVSNISFNVSKFKPITQVNLKFKDIHNGERCFILGTGPSLKKIDYKFLENEITFGVNYLYKGEIVKYIKPQYYFLYDQIFHTTHISDTQEIINLLPNTTLFLRTKAYKEIKKSNIDSPNIYYQHCNLFQYNDSVKVDITKNVTAPFNVLLGCIQTAIYMGFKEIYLLGSDFNSFATPKVEHFYDKEDGTSRNMSLGFELKYYSMVCYHHYALEKYAKENGVRIYNLTPNSLLDAYEVMKIEDLYYSS